MMMTPAVCGVPVHVQRWWLV